MSVGFVFCPGVGFDIFSGEESLFDLSDEWGAVGAVPNVVVRFFGCFAAGAGFIFV